MRIIVFLIMFLCALNKSEIICSSIVYSQIKLGAISGKIEDAIGALVAGGEIEIINLATSEKIIVITDDWGEYKLNNLVLGKYQIKTDLFGVGRQSIVLTIEQGNNIVNLILECGGGLKELDPEKKKGQEFCEIHHVSLKLDTVKILYGLPINDFDNSYHEAKDKLFPNSNLIFEGGCMSDCYSKAEVLFCYKCRLNERLFTQKKKKKSKTSS